jgi:uncharacterized membrane protein
MALISIVLVIVGFLLSVVAGVIMSLPSKMQTKEGELDQSQINLFSIIITISVLMIMAGVLGYYFMRDNLPYYLN